LKGRAHVEAIGRRLQEQGVIDLRVESGVAPDVMPSLIESTDVIIDGLTLGQYGTTAAEAMASGRIVLANISRVIDRPPEPAPIVHVTPDTLEDTLRQIADDPAAYRPLAAAGPSYVRRYHDGGYAARQLADFLGRETSGESFD
jgi:glycosyltransferase involved in cell wall biosynthesis